MNILKMVTASFVLVAWLAGTLVPAQAGSRLNEKNIIKKLIFKKKVRRTTNQRPVLRRKAPRRTFKQVIRKGNKTLKESVTVKRKRRVTRRKKTIQLNGKLTRTERLSRTRRKNLRRILTAKRRTTFTTKRRTRRAKRRIAFPPPAIEIVDSGASNIKRPGKTRPGKKTNGTRNKPTKWARTTPSRQRKAKKTIWRKSVTRSKPVYVEDADDPYSNQSVEPVRVATTRRQRDQIKSIVDAEGLPQVDIEIYFDYNSATIRPRSMPDVGVLGRALRNEQLAGSQFMIIGHTDAKGSDSYNLSLSEDRANAVRNFLVNVFGLDGTRFFPVGYGEEQLKRVDIPSHAENRRVQIVNIGSAQQ